MMSTGRLTGWHKFKLCFRVLLLYTAGCVKGLVEISPSEVAPVCQAGDQLDLTCSVTGSFLRWELTVIRESEPAMPFRVMPIVTSNGPSGVPPPVTANSTRFTSSRISAQDSTPLISMMTINPVSEGLNGVEVKCVDVEVPSESVATTIRIGIGTGDIPRLNISVRSHSVEFFNDRATVLLEWTVSLSRIYYQELLQSVSVNVVPDSEVITTYIGNMSVQLTLQYNTLYNVNITQPGICGQPNQTTFIQLNYSKCSNPMALTPNSAVQVMGYKDPALEGVSITFTCTSGMELSGPSSSMCMRNGEWDPDPREVNCTEPGTEITTINVATKPVCMPNGTSTCSESKPSDDYSNETIKISLGIVFGVLTAVLAVILVVLLTMFLKGKGFLKHLRRKLDNSSGYILDASVEREALGDPNRHNHKADETLFYADIGPASFPKQQKTQKSNLLDFNDSRVEYAQLNHSVHKDKVSTLKVSSTVIDSDNCPPVNLDNLLIQLRPQVAPKWYQFGEAAGIGKKVLDEFAEQCPPDQCIVELFDYWLRSSVKPLTWKTVADVLKAINHTELGCDIENVYTTGTLPIEVDMTGIPQLDLQEEEEPPPPVPARSVHLHIDTPPQGSKPEAAILYPPPPLSDEVSVPALPPKPAHMKSNTLERD